MKARVEDRAITVLSRSKKAAAFLPLDAVEVTVSLYELPRTEVAHTPDGVGDPGIQVSRCEHRRGYLHPGSDGIMFYHAIYPKRCISSNSHPMERDTGTWSR